MICVVSESVPVCCDDSLPKSRVSPALSSELPVFLYRISGKEMNNEINTPSVKVACNPCYLVLSVFKQPKDLRPLLIL